MTDGFRPEESGEGEDFSALFEASMDRLSRPAAKDSKVVGTVVSTSDEWVFVDIGGKSEGSIASEELKDEQGNLTVKPGDQIECYVISSKAGETLLSVKMTAAASDDALRSACRSGLPVEGQVVSLRKGGYQVNVLGKNAFCPFSQMDLYQSGPPEQYVGKKMTFRIVEYSGGGKNIVLSRRQLLEEEQQKKVAHLKEILKPGDIVEGTVRNLASFGAFVDLGGIEGLIPMSELAWHKVKEPSEILRSGERVTVKILDLDWEKKRISLSLKQMGRDPWETVQDRYRENQTMTGTVTRLTPFGAFVQLEPGIEGLIHISHMSAGKRIAHPKDVLSEGQEVPIRVMSVDPQAKRISLEIYHPAPEKQEGPELKAGDIVKATVDSVKKYGVFMNLPGRRSGLLHVSEISGEHGADLRKKFQPGSTFEVEILAIDDETGKISLSTKSLGEGAENGAYKDYVRQQASSNSFGTLADLLKKKG
jgi:small subunit ribosomal protein S1